MCQLIVTFSKNVPISKKIVTIHISNKTRIWEHYDIKMNKKKKTKYETRKMRNNEHFAKLKKNEN